MKKTFLFTTLFISILFYSQIEGSKQIYSIDNLKDVISKHKTIAILPFETKISYRKQPKNFSAEANRDQEKSLSTSVQSSMYTFLLRKKEKYSVQFQDVEKTNILLKRAKIFDKLDEYTKEEISKILEVDAVIGGKYEVEQTKSEAGAIASAILFGGFGGKTGTGSLTMTINDGSTGELVWRFFKTMNDGIMTSSDDVIEHMMRKVSRNFPYINEK